MENQMSINDEIFDLLLKEALIEKYNRDVRTAMENARPHDFSPELEKRIRKISRSIGRKERIQSICKVLIKVLLIAAAVMGIAFGGLLTQPKVYAAVQEVFKTVFSTHDNYTYQGNGEDISFDNNLRFGYIPDGYELRSGFYSTSNVSLTYESPDGKYIYFDYGLAENSLVIIDNEDNKYIELKNNEIDYYFYESQNLENDLSVLLWYSNGYFYSINAQLLCDEIMKIAENII